MNADFILAIGIGKREGIDPELLFQAVEEALVTAYKRILVLTRMSVLI